MPVFNRELVPDIEEKSGLQPDNQSKELIMASLAGAISMAPALLMTFY